MQVAICLYNNQAKDTIFSELPGLPFKNHQCIFPLQFLLTILGFAV